MDLDISKDSLEVYKALASSVRIDIIQELSSKRMSVQDLSKTLKLSSAIVLMHLNKLAEAGIIGFERHGHKKISYLKVDNINVHFPKTIYPAFAVYDTQVPVANLPIIPSLLPVDWQEKTIISVKLTIPLIL